MIDKLLRALGERATLMLALGVFVAIAAPPVATLLRPLLAPAMFGVLTLSILATEPRALAAAGRRPWRTVAAVVWLLLVSPLVMTAVLAVVPAPPGVGVALVLFAALPPITAVPAYALLLGLDSAFAVVVLATASLAAPILLPPVALMLLGIELEIAVFDLMQRLALMIGGAFVLAWLIRRAVGGAAIAAHSIQLSGAIVLLMVVLAIAIMEGVTVAAAARPALMAWLVVAAFAANVSFQALGAIAFLPWGRGGALTMGLCSGYRNLALLLAVLGDAATLEFSMFVAAAQLPIYLMPAIQQPLYRRLRNRGAQRS